MESHQIPLGSAGTSVMGELRNANNKVLRKALGEFMERIDEPYCNY